MMWHYCSSKYLPFKSVKNFYKGETIKYILMEQNTGLHTHVYKLQKSHKQSHRYGALEVSGRKEN